ncbi:MAG: HEAT repeat domain-containing protein [Fimbriiglobus sp.]|jgi:hypothetical protein|nr:HEAT repeat domain-containing protein [Fimbriiglobus sp.]
MRAILAVFATGLLTTIALAADQKAVNDAIKRGGEFLRQQYAKGVPQQQGGSEYGLGATALSGLAMLEAGVKADDPAVKNVADTVRKESLRQTNTYHIALAIIFLDRHGDRGDIPLIQMLGVRLYAGMNAAGGWTYQCWENVQDAETLLKSLQNPELTNRPTPPPKGGKDDGFLKPEAGGKAGSLHPEVAKVAAVVQQAIRATGRGGRGGVAGDDNSNTQFGIVGLWVASRHGVPVRDAFALIEARFVQSQGRDGGWGYTGGAASGGSTPAMTCAGLLGLAVGRAARDTPVKKDPPKNLPEDDPFFNPKKSDGEKADTLNLPKAVANGRDRSTEAGLTVLAAFVGSQQQATGNGLRNFVGAGNSLYTLWSLERVGVAYGLETLGGVNWYDWGVSLILPMQQADGSFLDGSYQADVNTSFAILFLAKSNFTRDLNHKKTADPGKGELRGGGAAPLQAPPPKQPQKQGGPPQGADPDLPTGGFALPKVAEPTVVGEAEKVAKTLLSAGDAEWLGKVTEARDTKGAKWTHGLVLAIAKLDGDKRHQAREALAERLVRMTPRTLREMLKDPEIELRRAACLACGMRDERAFAPALIERLTDPSEFVVRAARASLKSLTGNTTDFGPANGSDEEARVKAASQWAAWFDQNK